MNLTKSFLKISTLLLICVCLTACPNTQYLRVDQETKDYCLFDQGSYWIFQDSATMRIDNFFIYEKVFYDIESFGGHEWDYYKVNVLFTSQDDISNFYIYINSYESEGYGTLVWYNYRDELIYHNGDTLEHNEYYRLKLLEIKDYYTVNDITYNKVKKFKSSRVEKGYYWAENVGLIREETYTKDCDGNDSIITARNLIEYKVKPYIENNN